MKRTFLKLAFVTLVAGLVSACATGPKFSEVASSMPALKAGDGRIYFFRSSSMIGGAIQPDIRLNGQVVGESKPGGFFYVDRPAGNYVASASTETEKSVSFKLEPGETKYIRSSIGMGLFAGRPVLEPEDPRKASAELASLSYTGSITTK